jgi:carboxymethylenebutenolidase
MTQRVEFRSKSGEIEHGEIAEPSGAGKSPALLVIQEWWGVNDHIRSLVNRFAKEGFLAFAPDLYHGKITKDGGEAASLLKGLDWKRAVQDVAGAAAYLTSHPRSTGKVGITGFCMGGAVALAAAANVPELLAVVPFYGIPDAGTDYSKVTAAIQGHFGNRDDFVKPAYATALKDKLEQLGKKIELHSYDAGHAFMNDTRPEAYDAASAKLAWERAVTFLKAHL